MKVYEGHDLDLSPEVRTNGAEGVSGNNLIDNTVLDRVLGHDDVLFPNYKTTIIRRDNDKPGRKEDKKKVARIKDFILEDCFLFTNNVTRVNDDPISLVYTIYEDLLGNMEDRMTPFFIVVMMRVIEKALIKRVPIDVL